MSPVQACQSEGRSGFQWGASGKCFTGPDAKERAAEQGRAAYANGYEHSEPADSSPHVNNVETFIVGTHTDSQGNVYRCSEADLQEIVDNFHRLSEGPNPIHRPPVAIGHDEDDKRLKDSSEPAYGWVTGCKIGPDGSLYTSWSDVDPGLAQDIKDKKYRKVSAEINPDLVGPDGTHYGQSIRRVCALGAVPPAVKGMADIPAPTFADGQPYYAITLPLKFSEVTMPDTAATATDPAVTGGATDDRGSQEQQALASGFSQELLDSLDDNQLALLVRDYQEIEANETQNAGNPPVTTMADAPPPALGHDDLVAALKALGVTDEEMVGKTDEELAAMLAQKQGGTTGATTMSERHPKVVTTTQKFSEGERSIALRLAATERRQAAIERRQVAREKLDAINDEKKIRDFAENMVEQKRMYPRELDEKNPKSELSRLIRASRSGTVLTFSEGGKTVRMSELEMQMEEIQRRSPLLFSEQIHGDQGQGASARLSDDRRKQLLSHTMTGRSVLAQTNTRN